MMLTLGDAVIGKVSPQEISDTSEVLSEAINVLADDLQALCPATCPQSLYQKPFGWCPAVGPCTQVDARLCWREYALEKAREEPPEGAKLCKRCYPNGREEAKRDDR